MRSEDGKSIISSNKAFKYATYAELRNREPTEEEWENM